jgi:hypothetical protein
MNPLISVPSKMNGAPSKRMLRKASAKSCWESGDIGASKRRRSARVNRHGAPTCRTGADYDGWTRKSGLRRCF